MGFCSDFHQIKTFGGAVATPAPPASYTSDYPGTKCEYSGVNRFLKFCDTFLELLLSQHESLIVPLDVT